ncbi:glycosyltransferase [Aestuariimicrobium sp. Y1814]|uniref:glycosyltransferase n=1 Tax=Aestuariimicrobium sp. Y1814 TaxID=3418742 RepID=UPI003DA7305C
MSSVVFLLTNVFPYAKGEEFLENEVSHLAAGFDRVVIVATQTTAEATQTRTVPDNCTVLRAGVPRPGGAAAAMTVTRGLAHLARRPQGLPVHPGKVATESLFEGRAQNSLTRLVPQLDGLRLHAEDHIVVYSYWFHITARVGMLLAEVLRERGLRVAKLVSRAHRYDLYPEESPFEHLPERQLLLDAYDEVHPVSDHGTALLRRQWPRYAPKVTTRRLGTKDPGALVECQQDPPHVVSCSFVLPVKRVDRIPGILQRADEATGDIGWTHFGSGDQLTEVKEQAERDLGDLVDMPGYVPNSELAERYRELRPVAFLNVSESEGVPVSIMEAIALGIPVVATDVGGVGEIVHDGVNGFLLPKQFTDLEAAAALNSLVTMPAEQYRGFCRAARERWEAEFNESVVYARFVEELRLPPQHSGRPLPNVGG